MRYASQALLLVLLLPSTANALTLGSRTSTSGVDGFELSMGVQLFARGRMRRPDGGTIGQSYDLNRARLKTTFRYGRWLRVDLEPDFGGADADLADVFLQISPVDDFDIRVGQAKTPFGVLELEGRWRLPTLTRGIVSDVVSDRLGFGRRKFGARMRWRDRDLALKPEVEVGTYGQQGDELTDDLVATVTLRIIKGLHVALSGYARADAQTNNKRGYVTAFSAHYEKKKLYLVGEAQLGRAKLLSAAGIETGIDATFFAARVVAAYRFGFAEDFAVEPFVGGDLFDPNADTTDDISVGLRLGANLLWRNRLRIGAQWGRDTGQVGAITSSGSALIVFLGTSLD